VTRGGKLVTRLTRNEFVGELSVLRHAPRNASVTAQTELDVLVLTSNAIEPLLEEMPHLATALLYEVVDRLGQVEEGASS
jgi:CRP-like cAMP-binding protein